jgi:demethylmenaquinone methyltransferase/2-methoxy-6-polyprenyl-1,4-benzoquinol methylase
VTTRPVPPAPRDRGTAPANQRERVAALFDDAARDYDRIGGSLDLGSGHWYRRFALRRAGLRPGMTLLDVATGTGLLGRAGARVLGHPRSVVGIDANAAMLREACQAGPSPLVQGWAEALPFRSDRFDVVSIGYLFRYVEDLESVLRECRRVLKPGGRLLALELSLPESRGARWVVRAHLQRLLPWIVKLRTRSEPARLLTRYCWDTIDHSVPAETILDLLRRSGFVDVRRHVWFGLFAEYFATRPADGPQARGPSHAPHRAAG